MALIQTIDRKDADERLEEIYASVAGKATDSRLPEPANILKVQSLHPAALEAHYGFYKALMFKKGALSRAQRELIAVAVSQANDCHY
ncbi:MAG: carboxymuconolactone decarboxylase family protein [Planctomycetota bacterium]|jgi:alkylhydroperoxidase family enzyme